MLQQTANIIDKTNRIIGRTVSWLALFMVFLMFANVVGRYALNTNLIWQAELVGFMHAIMFLSAAGYTLLDDKHVRVDVFYHTRSAKFQAAVNLLGTIFFLFPFCACILFFSLDFVINSWEIFEGSSEYNGMQGVFILKTFIWVFAATLFLQGISTICTSLLTIKAE